MGVFHRSDAFLKKSRVFRSRYFGPIASAFKRVGIHQDLITALSFMSGLAAVWFLFYDHLLFVVFGLLHLLLDGFDGIVARTDELTNYGAYIDSINDQFIAILLLAKIAFVYQNIFIAIVTALYTIEMTLYVISRLRMPLVFVRFIVLAASAFQFYLIGAVAAGCFILYNGILVARYQFTLFSRKKKAI